MATINWRGDVAYLNWRENGKQNRKSLGQISEYDAETRRQEKELEVRVGRRLFQSSELFGVTAVRYLDWHRTQYPDSNERSGFVIERRFNHLHDRPLATITQMEIEEWVTKRAKQVSSGTVKKELNTLKAFLNKAVEWDKLAKNPAAYVQAPANLDSEPIHWYSVDELQRLYKVDPLHADTWQFLANTGLRRREAMQLRWEDIRDGSIWLTSKQGARTKSAKWRQVPLSPGAVEVLPRLRQGNKTIYVIPRLAKVSWSRAFSKALERANLEGSLHSLRHSFAANLVLANVSLRVIQRLMGHATIKTTEQYAHVAESALKGAVGGLQL